LILRYQHKIKTTDPATHQCTGRESTAAVLQTIFFRHQNTSQSDIEATLAVFEELVRAVLWLTFHTKEVLAAAHDGWQHYREHPNEFELSESAG
jgi:hypothetical protein